MEGKGEGEKRRMGEKWRGGGQSMRERKGREQERRERKKRKEGKLLCVGKGTLNGVFHDRNTKLP